MVTPKQATHIATAGNLLAATGVAAVAGLAWFYKNELMSLMGYQRIHMSEGVKAQLPIAKNFQTIPDFDANYDMDGVSFDSEGVVVSSDRHFENEATQQNHH
jgi:hypothetical protein